MRPRTPQPGAAARPRRPRARASPFEPEFCAFLYQKSSVHALWLGNLEHQMGGHKGRHYAFEPEFSAFLYQKSSVHALWLSNLEHQMGGHEGRRYAFPQPRLPLRAWA